ncbi:hypothetical protein ACJMCD_28630 (plasmid) [Priestia megaterium]|uniref:hypothetical protein n=1 Tax=Priestia megaterium TaxID=1404 RepID=UPI00389AAFDB
MSNRLNKKDFDTLNISNIPSNKEKLLHLLEYFKKNEFTWKEISKSDLNLLLGLSNETLRKMVNHSAMVGILNYNDRKYFLSEESSLLLSDKYQLDEYFLHILQKSEPLFINAKIIILLMKLFGGSLKSKSIYTIFSYVGKDRLDNSAQASVGRNIRAIFSILIMMGVITKSKDKIYLNKKSNLLNVLEFSNVQAIESHFNENIINVNFISRYLEQFFIPEVVVKVLSCISTYETDNYIWSKSSLYKNRGEVKNLLGDFIMTVIIKRRL